MTAQEAKYQHKIKIWTPVVQACTKSDLTIRDWCQENSINEKQYYYWQKRVREEIVKNYQSEQSSNATFVELQNPDRPLASSFQPDLVIHIGSTRLELTNTVSSNLLAQVLEVLKDV